MSVYQIFRVQESAFKAIIWASAAIAFPFVPFRLHVRWKVFRKFFIDDAFVVLAYLLLLAFACYWQVRLKSFYIVLEVAAGHELPGPDFIHHFYHFLRVHIFATITYGCSLWSVKLAFLFFFKRLGHNIRYQYITWWIVFSWNIVAFIIFLALTNWRCITDSPEKAIATCGDARTRRFNQRTEKMIALMDVLSDASIIIIPISLLWNVKIQLQKKLALGGIFSLSIFVMMASILRVAISTSTEATDESWLYAGAAIEMAIAVIVVCVGSFRALFSSKTLSQRLPVYHLEQRKKTPDRNTLSRFGFHEISRSSATILTVDRPHDTSTTYSSQSKRESLGFARAIGDARLNDGENQQVSTTVSAIYPGSIKPPLADNQIHVQREFSIYPEAPSPAKTRR